MFTLISSISCSVAVSILLKIARQRNIDVAQAIAVNYLVAVSLAMFLLKAEPLSLFQPATPWWILIALGVLLPSIFLAMAAAVKHAGIVLSDAAQRLSLFIPLIASFVLFGEALGTQKLTGIALALCALLLLLHKSSQHEQTGHTKAGVMSLLLVWVGYGVIDILFKQLSKSGAAFPSSLALTFSLAGVLMFAYLLYKRTQWNQQSLFAGLVLGLLNFGNIYFYIRAHQTYPENPTLVFSAMNIGVISLGALVGAGFFKEKLSIANIIGVVLAVVAVLALIPR
ncbi:EamA family transporter [Alcaligenes endophyticus]|uniref:EamA/RhaT family transporter n=1 Tax=Alcaligenes endophyticus TaxID=1929088 RepID=A0ABT8EGU9_9BURK|nr:EamA family transporter [Alcaligenes endophyticus]MCX5589826.1 EamA/RhaT family transporter [Alcaligenes endophyticus]MDN4120511.1 EamA/RhaT family transporter [Alcaligenes endophyticus]